MNEPSVSQHYDSSTLRDRIELALAGAGLSGKPLTWRDLTALDQFHTRGSAASEELAAALSPRPGTHVLDVGSGVGGPARFLAATYGCHVTGIDLTESFVDVATELSARVGMTGQTTFHQADALALPYADSSFDDVWTQHVAMNIADRPQLYAEIFRVLKPGGRLAAHDIVAGTGGPLFYPVPWASSEAISFLLTADGMRRSLLDAGFAITAWDDKTAPTLAAMIEYAARLEQNGGPPPLSTAALIGESFADSMANLTRNFDEGRAGALQVIATRPA
jgi:SAM-dependent methyltransferase